MTPDTVIDIFRQTVLVVISILAVIMVPALVIGLIIAMFQAATQINEQSLSFIPKVFFTFLTLMLAGPWILKLLTSYARNLISEIPFLIG